MLDFMGIISLAFLQDKNLTEKLVIALASCNLFAISSKMIPES